MVGDFIGDNIPDADKLRYQSFQELYLLQVAFLTVMKKPRSFFRRRHIRELGYAMVIVEMSEHISVATVSWNGLVLQLLEVDELCLVDQDEVKALGIRRSLTVLTDDRSIRAVVE